MGFVTGFTGGVTLTLGVAYLTVLAHQRNRERQADILRANAIVLNNLSAVPGTKPVAIAPSRAEIELVRRAHFVEAAKDKWNAELEGAVRWAQNTDWNRVREDVESAAERVWGRVAGGEVQEGVRRVEDGALRAKEEAVALERRAEAEARSVSAAARSAVEESRAKTASTLQDKAAEAKATAAEVVQRGVEKSRELVGKAQAAVGLVEAKAVNAAAVAREKMTESDVERALRQRYEPHALQTPEEVYAERYTPVAQTDHSRLRGV